MFSVLDVPRTAISSIFGSRSRSIISFRWHIVTPSYIIKKEFLFISVHLTADLRRRRLSFLTLQSTYFPNYPKLRGMIRSRSRIQIRTKMFWIQNAVMVICKLNPDPDPYQNVLDLECCNCYL